MEKAKLKQTNRKRLAPAFYGRKTTFRPIKSGFYLFFRSGFCRVLAPNSDLDETYTFLNGKGQNKRDQAVSPGVLWPKNNV
ncbi:hypothetical protein FRX31_027532 [Thalictrum thalictroides]|uniref:Uncharacterized protein n=1 Tax=Thalictrum thalictroides TaxID=46969 RepID=A0A7J6VDW3_THATH|nr:hypothetical protein FRX31_027532 [Thalictrum thalictroides]